MKNLLRKLHIGGGGVGNDEVSEEGSKAGSTTKGRPSFSDGIIGVGGGGESRGGGGLSGWLTSVARHALPMQPSTSCQSTNPPCRTSETNTTASSIVDMVVESLTSPSSKPLTTTADKPVSNIIPSVNNSNSRNGRALSPVPSLEEYQVQLAMALSVQDDPDEVQLEAAKQISMGAFSSSASTPAEVVAFRYWNYNMLDYDDRIVDGFYDVYGVVLGSNSEKMPSLVDLQGTPLSEDIAWEAVLVNRATDPSLKELVMNTVALAVDSKAVAVGPLKSGLVEKIAGLVAEQMGGAINDPDEILKSWKEFSDKLKSSHKSIVLPLGRLGIGLARHRALLFKVLADAVGIPCKLVKGHQFTGSNEGALNIIKLDDAREFIVDLMGAPGFLIPSDGSSVGVEAAVDFNPVPRSMKNVKSSPLLSEVGIPKSRSDNNEHMVESDAMDTSKLSKCAIQICQEEQSVAILPPAGEAETVEKVAHAGGRHYRKAMELPPARPTHRRAMPPFAHMRSPSWTEGIGSPAVRDMKVKDVSQYMMTAAKENPGLAKKLQDVLAESGVMAPPHLFTDMSPKQLQSQVSEDKKLHFTNEEQKDCKDAQFQASESNDRIGNDGKNNSKDVAIQEKVKVIVGEVEENPNGRLPKLNSVEGLGKRRPLETSNIGVSPLLAVSSCTKDSQDAAVKVLSVVQETLLPEFAKRVPVAAAAAATAAMVASSMVVAASKTNSSSSDPNFEVPVAAAATATAAVVVATSAFGGRNAEKSGTHSIHPEEAQKDTQNRKIEDSDRSGKSPQGSGQNNAQADESNLQVGLDDGEGDADGLGDSRNKDRHIDSSSTLEERLSNKSNESLSSKSDSVMDDVAEWEIQWEDLVIGERIGIGSYGEVYRGDWNGTEVAVKKFLNQDISGDALEEFRSEVRIMKRLRHPNVVLFMGAVTRPPNLSIVTEFIPRGSLYRLIHRSNNQLDERRRMRMALDVARGMNYFHSCTPVIVHRDLKSPNLLVDKNWVVKVCDFGLSRIKHNTFLSSKSTSGTPEWMAPEVLRNEPSNEKSDVYSFGMILWELATLQQPWGTMNAMQVVGAVAFQHRRLEIPSDVDPIVASIIQQCWQSDPNLRPSFTEILAALKPLQKPIISPRSANTTKPGVLVSRPLPETSQYPTSDNIVERNITEGKRKDP